MNDKATLYAEASIVEYWIVDAANACIHVFRQPESGAYTERATFNRGDQVAPLAAERAALDLEDLFGAD